MATTGQSDESAPAASDVAARCRMADLVRLVGAPDGTSLAALGLLGRALSAAGVGYHASLGDDPAATEADLTVAVGVAVDADEVLETGPGRMPIERAYAVAAELADPDPALALAGQVAAGREPAGRPLEDATAAGIDRRPGVAVPTADLADGLAHTTLVRAPFSGDPEAAAAALEPLDLPGEPTADDRRRVASLVGLGVAEAEGSTPGAARAVERVLRPHVGGPVETIGGYAALLDALARTRPGTAVAVAVGATDAASALDAWRERGRRVHRAVDDAEFARHDGLFVARVGVDDVATVARLLMDYRSPEPTVLAIGDEGVALATGDDGPDPATVLEAATADDAVRTGADGIAVATAVEVASVVEAMEVSR